ncbi:flagellar hook-length control protein FliK [Enterovibrio calviensis]|uniref:flagellar hook-length control protein FliK n=1 Tax=Enterovibrio calviensis TaxID=91359 RepID=UPI003734EAE4
MKIDNGSNINVLTLENIQSKLQGKLLQVGQDKTGMSSPPQPLSSQLAQVLRLINLFPLLLSSPTSSLLGNTPSAHAVSTLLKALVMPSTPELAAKWLAERQSDKALLDALRLITSGADDEGSGKLKALLMLVTEQRLQDGNKANEHHWLFPLSHLTPTPVRITAKKKTLGKRKKSRWSVTVNLTLSKNRHLTATAELEEKSLSLTLTTDSPALHQKLEHALPTLEKQLNKHQICISECKIEMSEYREPVALEAGVNIQV